LNPAIVDLDDGLTSDDPHHLSLTSDLEIGEGGPVFLELVADLGEPNQILDLGAGGGRLSFPLAEKGYAVTAVEGNPSLARLLADRAATVPNVIVEARRFADFHPSIPFKVVIIASPLASTLVEPDAWQELWDCVRRAAAAGATVVVETFTLAKLDAHRSHRWPQQSIAVRNGEAVVMPRTGGRSASRYCEIVYENEGAAVRSAFAVIDLSDEPVATELVAYGFHQVGRKHCTALTDLLLLIAT
jgi:SAM-dependent methyltransferase